MMTPDLALCEEAADAATAASYTLPRHRCQQENKEKRQQ